MGCLEVDISETNRLNQKLLSALFAISIQRTKNCGGFICTLKVIGNVAYTLVSGNLILSTDKTPTDCSLNCCYPCLFGSQIWSGHFKFFLCLTTSDCKSVLVAALVRKAGDRRLIVENQLSLFLTITARHVVDKSVWF